MIEAGWRYVSICVLAHAAGGTRYNDAQCGVTLDRRGVVLATQLGGLTAATDLAGRRLRLGCRAAAASARREQRAPADGHCSTGDRSVAKELAASF